MRILGWGAALAAAVAVATPAGAAEPVEYYAFRTLDSGAEPTAEQEARCDEAFGARAATATIRLNAGLFGFRVDPGSGRLTEQTASVLGPGFICGAPDPDGPDAIEAFAYTGLPGVGQAVTRGPCGLRPAPGQTGALSLTCRLGIDADPAQGLRGGLVTSNSVVNPGNLVPGTPTGSVWTAAVSRAAGGTPADVPPPANAEPPADPPGLEFVVARAVPETATADDCDGTGRTATLRAVQPDLKTSHVPAADAPMPATAAARAPGGGTNAAASASAVSGGGAKAAAAGVAGRPVAGRLTLCLGAATETGGRRATAAMAVGAGPLLVTASGECRAAVTPAGGDVRAQSCALDVDAAGGVRGGVLTSNGLVDADDPARAVDAGVWTLSLAGGAIEPVATPPVPRATLRLKRRGRRVVARWSGRDLQPPARFRVQVRRGAGRWRTARLAPAARRLAIRSTRRVSVRVTGRDAGGGRTARVVRSVR